MRRLIYLALSVALVVAQAATTSAPFPTRVYNSFVPNGSASVTFTTTTSNNALPASGAVDFVCNTNSALTAFVAFGTSNAVTATTTGSFAILPTSCVRLDATGYTYWAGITSSGSAVVTISVGTGSP